MTRLGSDCTRDQIHPEPRKHFTHRKRLPQKVTEQPCPQHGPCHNHNTGKAPRDTGGLCSVEVSELESRKHKSSAQRFCQTGPLGGYPWNQTMSHAVEEGRKSWDESWAHFAWKEAFPVPHEESHSSQQCQGTPPTPPLLGAIQDVSEEKRTQQEMRRGWWHHTGDTMTSSHPQSAAGKIPSGVGSSSGTQCEHSSWPGHGDTGTHCSFKQQTA